MDGGRGFGRNNEKIIKIYKGKVIVESHDRLQSEGTGHIWIEHLFIKTRDNVG